MEIYIGDKKYGEVNTFSNIYRDFFINGIKSWSDWEYPVQINDSLIITQAFNAIDSGGTLIIE